MVLVTITEIAEKAEVSRSTVVRVINKKGKVSEDKRVRVEQALDELGYVPNKIAQGLKNQSTKMIGHIMPSSYPNPFFARVSNAIEKSAHDLGYSVLTMITDRDVEREQKMIEELLGRMVDGIIFTSAFSTEQIKKVAKLEKPIIMLERADDITGVDTILSDETAGSYAATSYMIARGHRKIACIAHEPVYSVEKGRLNGYLKAVQSFGLDPEQYLKYVNYYSPEQGYEAARELFGGNRTDATAVFVGSDILAVGVMQYFYDVGMKVPKDISIIGYDDTYSGMLAPKLTTVALPIEEIGRKAVELLIERTAAPELEAREVKLVPYLIERQSVGSV
ncbi:LacI family DNA-binding transcriptional regulator [Paenibacillus gansuensis]|uniref:LacI family DNA-binding transcriptional regulator n=1 Tax=Paenibacillus gansuensis TaxID=306542 RepID=A0ABW5PAZ9_9BACL